MNNEEWELIIRGYEASEYNEICYAYEIYKCDNKYKVITGYDECGLVNYENDYISSWKEDEDVFVVTKIFDSFIELYEAILDGDYCVVKINGVSININDMMNYAQVAKLFKVSVDKDLYEIIKEGLIKTKDLKAKVDNLYDFLDNKNEDIQKEVYNILDTEYNDIEDTIEELALYVNDTLNQVLKQIEELNYGKIKVAKKKDDDKIQSNFEDKIRNGEDTTVDDLTKLSDLTPAQLKRNGIYEVK